MRELQGCERPAVSAGDQSPLRRKPRTLFLLVHKTLALARARETAASAGSLTQETVLFSEDARRLIAPHRAHGDLQVEHAYPRTRDDNMCSEKSFATLTTKRRPSCYKRRLRVTTITEDDSECMESSRMAARYAVRFRGKSGPMATLKSTPFGAAARLNHQTPREDPAAIGEAMNERTSRVFCISVVLAALISFPLIFLFCPAR